MSLHHPDAAPEAAHLKETLQKIADEQVRSGEALDQAEAALAEARIFDPDALPLREMLYAAAAQALKNLGKAAQKPYFTRIDFQESGAPKQTYYIGRYGVLDSDALRPVVIDWRAPVANLYYSGQIGPMRYETPEGVVAGELTLKRQFGIEDGRLITIFDTDLVSQDAYLQSVLGAMTGDRLREIVTTIQAEQNFVIRYPLNKTLIVQGVAGSGKTTIALHRIAYLLYAFADRLRPEHMVILAPNPLFLNFIAGVLPDLGVERVRQTTFLQLMRDFIGPALPAVDESDRLERVLSLDPARFEELRRVAQYKGSLRLAERLDDWLDDFERRFAPDEGFAFGPVKLYDREQIDQFLLVDERPFPMQRRLAEFQKQLTLRAKAAARTVERWMMEEADRRAAKLRAEGLEPEALRERLRALYKSRDESIEQARAQVKPFVREAMKRFPKLDLLPLYQSFWQDEALSADPEAQISARYTLSRLEKTRKLELEDVAPVCLIAARLLTRTRQDVRHIVVDEAQDFNALEFYLLKKLAPGASMTVVGDLMQGINGWRGLAGWEALRAGVFGESAVTHHLVTSYRNTVEIMNVALRVARNRPTPGQQEARPVLRHGDEPRFLPFKTAKEQAARIAELIDAWRGQGLTSIAVIGKSPAKIKALQKLLPAAVGAKFLDVNAETYEAGVLLAPASAVKGLEFDGVILMDAGAEAFADADLDARLIYVCLTRALHQLAVLYAGQLTPLLRQAES